MPRSSGPLLVILLRIQEKEEVEYYYGCLEAWRHLMLMSRRREWYLGCQFFKDFEDILDYFVVLMFVMFQMFWKCLKRSLVSEGEDAVEYMSRLWVWINVRAPPSWIALADRMKWVNNQGGTIARCDGHHSINSWKKHLLLHSRTITIPLRKITSIYPTTPSNPLKRPTQNSYTPSNSSPNSLSGTLNKYLYQPDQLS